MHKADQDMLREAAYYQHRGADSAAAARAARERGADSEAKLCAAWAAHDYRMARRYMGVEE